MRAFKQWKRAAGLLSAAIALSVCGCTGTPLPRPGGAPKQAALRRAA